MFWTRITSSRSQCSPDLTERPKHPYELSRALRDRADARSIKFNHGSLYMVVQQLARASLIVAHETGRDGHSPERTVYALTPAGRVELREWMRELIEVPEHEYPHFVAALSLIAVLPPQGRHRTATVLWSGAAKHLGSAVAGMTLEDGTTGYRMTRADLYNAMLDEAASRDIRLEHGKRLLTAEIVDGGVRARFTDST